MGKVKMTNAQIEAFLSWPPLSELMNDNKELPVTVRYWLSVLVRECGKVIDPFMIEKERIFLRYCDKEDDVPKVTISEDGSRIYSFSQDKEKVTSEITELSSIEIEFPIERLVFTEKMMGAFSAKDMLLISSFADIKIE